MFRKNKGFTLVELLIVIAIIGILSTLVVTSTRKTRMKARDSARISDINAFDSSVELYYEIEHIPPQVDAGGLAHGGARLDKEWIEDWAEFKWALTDYIKGEVPDDPLADSNTGDTKYGYVYCSTGVDYMLAGVFEVATTIRKDIDLPHNYDAAECIGSDGLLNPETINCSDDPEVGGTAERRGSTFCLGYTTAP